MLIHLLVAYWCHQVKILVCPVPRFMANATKNNDQPQLYFVLQMLASLQAK